MKILTLLLMFSLHTFAATTPAPVDKTDLLAPQTLEKTKEIESELHSNLLPSDPIYFLYGKPPSKVQLSFKLRVLKDFPLYLKYRQVIFWAIEQNSSPFRDTTYNPEIVYSYDIKNKTIVDSIDFGIFEHNSNGKDGGASRSFNRYYVRANFVKEWDPYIVKLSTKLSSMYDLDEGNSDIRNYISPLEIQASVTRNYPTHTIDRAEFSLKYFPGGERAQRLMGGGIETGMSFRFGGISFLPALYIQYYHGYAESLVTYNEKVSYIRAGLIF